MYFSLAEMKITWFLEPVTRISIQLISLCWKEKSENHKAQSTSLSYNNVLLTTLDENDMIFKTGDGISIRSADIFKLVK